MSVVVILILAGLTVGLVFVGAFVWSVRSGQYEDTLTPSLRVLADDAAAQAPKAAGAVVPAAGKIGPVLAGKNSVAPPGDELKSKSKTKYEHRNIQI